MIKMLCKECGGRHWTHEPHNGPNKGDAEPVPTPVVKPKPPKKGGASVIIEALPPMSEAALEEGLTEIKKLMLNKKDVMLVPRSKAKHRETMKQVMRRKRAKEKV